MERLELGTKETLLVDLTDRLAQVSDLATHSPTYTVIDKDGGKLYDAEPAPVDLMQVQCLIDTTVGVWEKGEYELLVGFAISPDVPLIRAGVFKVI